MNTLTENELKMYLGTGLKVQEYYDESTFILNAESFDYTIEYSCKPILYPLDWLTQPIWHEGKEVYVMDMIKIRELRNNLKKELDLTNGQLCIEFIPFGTIEILAKYHFDIHNLISQNKAIAVTNEFNPYR